MRPRLPGCPPWCSSLHQEPGGAHVANLDLIEHLDNPSCLVEVNVRVSAESAAVELLFTDMDGETTLTRLDREQAGTIGHIIQLFDRRGTREIGQLLFEGAGMLGEVTS